MPENPPAPLRFRHGDRLHGAKAFAAVFDAKLRKNAGPLTVFSVPNSEDRHRLGLSVSRRVGEAVVRGRIKRMLREAFRLNRHDWPGSYDWVVVVRPHAPAELPDYARWLTTVAQAADKEWARRR